jgi:hypothetical protein
LKSEKFGMKNSPFSDVVVLNDSKLAKTTSKIVTLPLRKNTKLKKRKEMFLIEDRYKTMKV